MIYVKGFLTLFQSEKIKVDEHQWYKKEKKSLIEWLNHKNLLDSDKKNLEFIRQTWNLLNTDNKNVAQ
jgi:hypothetical protein